MHDPLVQAILAPAAGGAVITGPDEDGVLTLHSGNVRTEFESASWRGLSPEERDAVWKALAGTHLTGQVVVNLNTRHTLGGMRITFEVLPCS